MKTEEAKEKSCACIYRIIFPDGMCYVGKTKCLRSRIGLYERFSVENDTKVNEALKKFGIDNVEWTILSEVNVSSSKEDIELCLSVLEIKYIKAMNTIYPNGYNVSIGGEILGIPVDCLVGINPSYNYNNGNKHVLVYDIDGNFLKEFESIGRCAYNYGLDEDEVRHNLGKMKSYKGKIFREKKYNYVPEKIDVTGIKIVNRIKYKTVIVNKYVEREINIGRPCAALLYDENGDFVGEFSSKIKALRTFTKAHSIPFGKYSHGYVVYKKTSDDYPRKIEPYVDTIGKKLGDEYKPLSECEDLPLEERKRHDTYERKGYHKHTNLINSFRIRQYDGNGFEKFYDNMRDAAEQSGVRYCNIWACVMGRVKKSGGFHWEKVDD